MTARIVERLEPALEIADDDDALGPDLDDPVVPGRGISSSRPAITHMLYQKTSSSRS